MSGGTHVSTPIPKLPRWAIVGQRVQLKKSERREDDEEFSRLIGTPLEKEVFQKGTIVLVWKDCKRHRRGDSAYRAFPHSVLVKYDGECQGGTVKGCSLITWIDVLMPIGSNSKIRGKPHCVECEREMYASLCLTCSTQPITPNEAFNGPEEGWLKR
jgi:hypothetical protein